MCLVFRASVVAKVEFFQHLCAVTGPYLMENSVWEGVQLGERCTSVPAQSAGQHLQDQGGATSSINSILLGLAVRPWGASACGAVSWVPTGPTYSALRRLGLEYEKEFTLQTSEGQGWRAGVGGRGWSEQAEKLTVSCVFGPRVCWRENWWLGRFLATPLFLWGVVTRVSCERARPCLERDAQRTSQGKAPGPQTVLSLSEILQLTAAGLQFSFVSSLLG